VPIEEIFVNVSPNQCQSVSSPQFHCSAASYVITLLQQLAELCCVSHFAAVCTTFTLQCAVVLYIGNVHLIGLCESQGHVVCWFSLMQPKNIIIIIVIIVNIIIIIIIIIIPFHATVSSTHSRTLATFLSLTRLPALCNGQ